MNLVEISLDELGRVGLDYPNDIPIETVATVIGMLELAKKQLLDILEVEVNEDNNSDLLMV